MTHQGVEVRAPDRRERPAMLLASLAGFAALALIWLSSSALDPLQGSPRQYVPTPQRCLDVPEACVAWAPPSLASFPAPGQLTAWRLACDQVWDASTPTEARLKVPVGCRMGLPATQVVSFEDWEAEALGDEVDRVRALLLERDWGLLPHAPHRGAQPIAVSEDERARISMVAAEEEAWLATVREQLWTASLQRPADRSTGVMAAAMDTLSEVWGPVTWWAGLAAALVAALSGVLWLRASRGVTIRVTAHHASVGAARVPIHELRSSTITRERVVFVRTDGTEVRSPPIQISDHSVDTLRQALSSAHRVLRGARGEDPDARRSIEALSKRTR